MARLSTVSRLSDLPPPEQKSRVVRSMFDDIAPRYDLVNRVMTFGMDMGWRRKTVAAMRTPPGSSVLDVACGTGDFCRVLEKAGMFAIGLDYSVRMLEFSRARAPLILADALRLPLETGAFDGISCGFALRNVEDLPRLFDEFARVLRPGGRLGVLEVDAPNLPVLRLLHGFYFRKVVPLIGAALSDAKAYRYLPASTAYLPDSAELLRLLGRSGFAELKRYSLGAGAAQIITGTRA